MRRSVPVVTRYLANHGHVPDAGLGSHGNLWQAFWDVSADARYRNIAFNGNRLKDRRVNADYRKPFRGNLSKEAQAALQTAQRIIITVNSI